MNKNINDKINNAFSDYKETIWVYLKASNGFGENYDPYRNTGYVETFQSPLPVNAMVSQISPNGLIAKELGLSLTGAIEIIVNNVDQQLIKNAMKLKYNGQFYTTFNKALGSRMLMSARRFDMTAFTCFLEGNS